MRLDFIQDLHNTKRDYIGRMMDNKPACMKIAKKFDKEFFDGARRFGYGGYKYDGRWIPMAEKIIERYKLNVNSWVIDIGCGMGHLLYEIEKLSMCQAMGGEISDYALLNTILDKTFNFCLGKDTLNYTPDLILCINVLHNLTLPKLEKAFQTISKARKAYIVVESYRNEEELFNLECWNLTGEQFLRPEEWEWLFKLYNYKGDYEFLFFT